MRRTPAGGDAACAARRALLAGVALLLATRAAAQQPAPARPPGDSAASVGQRVRDVIRPPSQGTRRVVAVARGAAMVRPQLPSRDTTEARTTLAARPPLYLCSAVDSGRVEVQVAFGADTARVPVRLRLGVVRVPPVTGGVRELKPGEAWRWRVVARPGFALPVSSEWVEVRRRGRPSAHGYDEMHRSLAQATGPGDRAPFEAWLRRYGDAEPDCPGRVWLPAYRKHR